MSSASFRALTAPALLGESPLWDPDTGRLYYCDIAGHRLHRIDPGSGAATSWPFDTDVACCARLDSGGLLLAMRDGLWRFDPATGVRTLLADAPYEQAHERFNDGKCDPAGRFWVGTIYEPRQPPLAHLYRWAQGRLECMEGGITVSNGLAWSPDGRTQYWSDTTSHTVFAFDHDVAQGRVSGRRPFAQFPRRVPEQPLDRYGGRPDGAAVDAEGGYWVAMYEGSRVLRLSPSGELLQELRLPVRCPTMPCFGGPGLRTLFVTTARHGRPDEELAAQPEAGCVFAVQVEVPGLPIPAVRDTGLAGKP
jgi:sugar lactone lactonase YvrE